MPPKKQPNSYPYPKNISNDEFKEFVKVTDENKNKALSVGRIAYEIVRKDVNTLTIKRILEYRPKLTKGRMCFENHPTLPIDFNQFIWNEESVSDYRQMLIDCFGKTMKEGNLYVKLNDTKVKYKFI